MWLHYSWAARAGSFNLSSQFNYGPFSSRGWGEESFDFYVHRKIFHQSVWLTGTFYHVNPLSHSEGIKEAPKTLEDRHGWAANLAISGAAPLLHSWVVVPYQPPKPHSLPLDTYPDLWNAHILNHARHICLNHGYASKGEILLWKSVFM